MFISEQMFRASAYLRIIEQRRPFLPAPKLQGYRVVRRKILDLTLFSLLGNGVPLHVLGLKGQKWLRRAIAVGCASALNGGCFLSDPQKTHG